MELNADFAQRVAVHSAQMPWIASPMAGVDRRMLDRIGDEVARATSIVRYAPRSQFSPHTHGGGEEFLVLEGVFQDEHGDFPAGSYIRNPPTSSHTPGSEPGCVIFVKLWQFNPADRTQIRIDTSTRRYAVAPARNGVEIMSLFADEMEDVRLERWAPRAKVELPLPGGGEFLVIEGSFEEAGESFPAQSWLRLPAGGRLHATAGPEGCRLWVKTGHLAGRIEAPPSPQGDN
ncbi:MAG TPA: cupin domain-containing protein [Dongiaceae bacterium]|nr:cupin domain-containing protein [Dongiaceae bacterium]